MEDKKFTFQKLTPVSDADISVYENAIDFAFSNTDVKNIAISGAYSAGKSSILESYKAKHSEIRFVHLSLAHFRTPEQENSESDEIVKESILEGKILNQLIHQITANKIPQTNFRVKKGVNSRNLVQLTAFSSLFMGSIAFLMLASKVSSYVNVLPDNFIKSVLTPLASQYAVIPAALICISCSIAFIFSLIKAQKNKNVFRKISLQGNEIEIFEEQDDSYFDKYLNEVLYLFENVEADVIVFEDMDRFNASRIFERLREVNTLVNIQRKKEKAGKFTPLRFFYLLRDDIFVSKDRTKFFDYIIPIVPVVDSSNSYEQFLKHLKEDSSIDKFDQGFLQGLSLYVDDMRILKNIYNEFIVYFNRLNTTDLDCNKMMAMIAYKNLFPRDYNDLQLARGFVYEVFVQKDQLIENTLTKLLAKRKAHDERISQVKNEALINQQELDDVYIAKRKRLPKDYYGSLTPETQNQNQQYDLEYEQRTQAIKDKLDGNLSKLETELAEIDRDIDLTRTKSLKALITRKNINNVFAVAHTNQIGEVNEFKEIRGSNSFDLLKYLVRNGFIDETYQDYMTYFYDDSISANDKAYLRRVTDRRGAEYSYSLRDPKKVIESPVLRQIDFEQEETLNFDLLECLLHNSTEPKHAFYLKTLISQLKSTENFDFISKYYDTGKERKQFVIRLNEQWTEFFSVINERNTLSPTQIRQFSIDTLYYCDEPLINAVNVDNCLSEYISNSTDYLAISQPKIEKLINGFSLINVSFIRLDYTVSDKALFNAVYCNHLYSINFHNIALILRVEYQAKNDDDIKHKNFSLVQKQPNSPLAVHVTYDPNNIELYIDTILINCDGIISDDEDIAINILNNENIDSTYKTQYIRFLNTTIQDITRITEPALWPLMLSKGIILFTVNNSVYYFNKHTLDTALTEFINAATGDFDFSSTSNDFDEDVAVCLFEAVAVCNNLETTRYKKILNDLGYYLDNFEADWISDDKFKALISENILQMDADTLKYVREKYKIHIMAFIRQNLDEYLSLQTPEIFSLEEALQILNWGCSDDEKTRLLSFTKAPISITNKSYPDKVCAYIIASNFDPADKVYLYKRYSTFGKTTQTTLQTLALSDVNMIISQDIELDDSLLSVLLSSESVIRNQKIILFTMAIPKLTEDTCKNHFDELGLPDLKNIFTKGGSRRKYNKCEDVNMIFDALKRHGWIYEFKEDEQNNEKYLIKKNKPRWMEMKLLD